jgi:hypothetical protein
VVKYILREEQVALVMLVAALVLILQVFRNKQEEQVAEAGVLQVEGHPRDQVVQQ